MFATVVPPMVVGRGLWEWRRAAVVLAVTVTMAVAVMAVACAPVLRARIGHDGWVGLEGTNGVVSEEGVNDRPCGEITKGESELGNNGGDCWNGLEP
jgi:hypothetical protein